MASDNTFSNKKNTLLTELESIKTLLGGTELGDTEQANNTAQIQTQHEPVSNVLNTMNIPVLQHPVIESEAVIGPAPVEPAHSQTTAAPSPSVLPGQQSLFNTTDRSDTASIQSSSQHDTKKPSSSLAHNPFLPEHVRQRLQNASTADEQLTTPSPLPTVDASYTQQLIDQLVAHHLPKIEAELRQKLATVVAQHNRQLEK